MRRYVSWIIGFLGLSLLLNISAQAQIEITWEQLADLSYHIKNSDSEDMVWGKPKFGESLKELDGKLVTISGYMLPITVDRNEYMLSQYHFAECFFCGNGGPESVMGLTLKQDIKKPVLNDPVIFVGILRLNKKLYELPFKLEEAELISR